MSTQNLLSRTARAYQSEEEPERLFAHAGIYWRIVLFTMITVSAIGIAAGAYMLVLTFMALSTTSTQTAAKQVINKEQLATVVFGLIARQARFQQIVQSPQPVPDPSK